MPRSPKATGAFLSTDNDKKIWYNIISKEGKITPTQSELFLVLFTELLTRVFDLHR